MSNLDVANASAENIQFTPLDHQEWNVLWVRFPIPSASNIRLRCCRRGVCGFARGGCGAFFVSEDGPQLKIDALDMHRFLHSRGFTHGKTGENKIWKDLKLNIILFIYFPFSPFAPFSPFSSFSPFSPFFYGYNML